MRKRRSRLFVRVFSHNLLGGLRVLRDVSTSTGDNLEKIRRQLSNASYAQEVVSIIRSLSHQHTREHVSEVRRCFE